MTDVTDDERTWMPDPVSAEGEGATDISTTSTFAGAEGWANVNRAPHDRVSGVIFKRAANIRRVRYTLSDSEVSCQTSDTGLECPGQGEADVSWIFSEQPGSEEGILAGHTFRYFQDVELLPGASTEQIEYAEWDAVLYVVAGEGRLLHRPSSGSPNIVRPLRSSDAALIRGGELFAIANASDTARLRLIILGLVPSVAPRG